MHLDNLTSDPKWKYYVHADRSDDWHIYGCMKVVIIQTGWAILQNGYWSFNSIVWLTTPVGYAHLGG